MNSATQTVKPINEQLRAELLSYLRPDGPSPRFCDDTTEDLLLRATNLEEWSGPHKDDHGTIRIYSGLFKGIYAPAP